MVAVEDGIRDLLVAAGVGVFSAQTGWGIFIGPEPSKPDTTIAVREFAGPGPMPKWLIDFPRVQTMIRGAPGGYQAAKTKAQEVLDELHSIPSLDLNGDRWNSIIATSGPAYIGLDQTNRPRFTINFRLIIEPATGTYRQSL
jgi:hypothetical protein